MVNNKINVNVIDGLQPILDKVIDYDNITNCITEIPQDIKLELKDGVLTLKAGSRVYIPNGAGKFDTVTIASDEIYANNFNGVFAVFTNTSAMFIRALSNCFSGASGSVPAFSGTGVWYDTTNNLIKASSDSGATWSSGTYSLPLAIITISNGVISSIDQVFNGFGYVGSTAFILPGIKFLVPNGRNEDGSLKNIEMVEDRVHTRTITWNNSGGQKLFIGKYDLYSTSTIQYISTGSLSQYYQQETEPSMERYIIWYKPSENKTYRCDQDSSGNLIWKDIFPCYIGEWFTSATSPYPIISLTTALPFRAVDQNDFNKLDEEVVKTSGDQTITGAKTFMGKNAVLLYNNGQNTTLTLKDSTTTNGNSAVDITQATSNGKNQLFIHFQEGNKWITEWTQDPTTKGVKFSVLNCVEAHAPTPATTDNTTRIATTAFFRNNMQVVSALPSNPTTGVFYFVKE